MLTLRVQLTSMLEIVLLHKVPVCENIRSYCLFSECNCDVLCMLLCNVYVCVYVILVYLLVRLLSSGCCASFFFVSKS